MDLSGKRLVVIGGAGLIGSHTVDALVNEDVGSIVVYDTFSPRQDREPREALRDPRVSIFELAATSAGTDILDAALKDGRRQFHFAALWLLHCHDYPRSAFDVNVAGTFNVRSRRAQRRGAAVYLAGVRLWRRRRGADDREPSVQQPEFLRP